MSGIRRGSDTVSSCFQTLLQAQGRVEDLAAVGAMALLFLADCMSTENADQNVRFCIHQCRHFVNYMTGLDLFLKCCVSFGRVVTFPLGV